MSEAGAHGSYQPDKHTFQLEVGQVDPSWWVRFMEAWLDMPGLSCHRLTAIELGSSGHELRLDSCLAEALISGLGQECGGDMPEIFKQTIMKSHAQSIHVFHLDNQSCPSSPLLAHRYCRHDWSAQVLVRGYAKLHLPLASRARHMQHLQIDTNTAAACCGSARNLQLLCTKHAHDMYVACNSVA